MATSSLIRGAWYKPDRDELELHFWSGRRYLYSQIPPGIAEGFAAAASKGSFFNARIRNSFPCREVTDRARTRPGGTG